MTNIMKFSRTAVKLSSDVTGPRLQEGWGALTYSTNDLKMASWRCTWDYR